LQYLIQTKKHGHEKCRKVKVHDMNDDEINICIAILEPRQNEDSDEDCHDCCNPIDSY